MTAKSSEPVVSGSEKTYYGYAHFQRPSPLEDCHRHGGHSRALGADPYGRSLLISSRLHSLPSHVVLRRVAAPWQGLCPPQRHSLVCDKRDDKATQPRDIRQNSQRNVEKHKGVGLGETPRTGEYLSRCLTSPTASEVLSAVRGEWTFDCIDRRYAKFMSKSPTQRRRWNTYRTPEGTNRAGPGGDSRTPFHEKSPTNPRRPCNTRPSQEDRA